MLFNNNVMVVVMKALKRGHIGHLETKLPLKINILYLEVMLEYCILLLRLLNAFNVCLTNSLRFISRV